jgi:hypothetical protein
VIRFSESTMFFEHPSVITLTLSFFADFVFMCYNSIFQEAISLIISSDAAAKLRYGKLAGVILFNKKNLLLY